MENKNGSIILFVILFLAKLKELNSQAPQEHKLTEEFLECIEKLLVSVCGSDSSEPPPTIQQINLLWKAAHWPEGLSINVFIVLSFIVFV